MLSNDFYNQPTNDVARQLLGKFLVHHSSDGTTVGKIVETEAYTTHDPANHASRGKTARNVAMFGPAGTAYIYFIYGMYWCFNVVTGDVGVGEAVLIRAIEPVSGIDLMQRRRGTRELNQLGNGPAKLVIAMGITPRMNGESVCSSQLFMTSQWANYISPSIQENDIVTTTRIGVSRGQSLLQRYLLKSSPFVSLPPREKG